LGINVPRANARPGRIDIEKDPFRIVEAVGAIGEIAGDIDGYARGRSDYRVAHGGNFGGTSTPSRNRVRND
jgi:hypothetical protein